MIQLFDLEKVLAEQLLDNFKKYKNFYYEDFYNSDEIDNIELKDFMDKNIANKLSLATNKKVEDIEYFELSFDFGLKCNIDNPKELWDEAYMRIDNYDIEFDEDYDSIIFLSLVLPEKINKKRIKIKKFFDLRRELEKVLSHELTHVVQYFKDKEHWHKEMDKVDYFYIKKDFIDIINIPDEVSACARSVAEDLKDGIKLEDTEYYNDLKDNLTHKNYKRFIKCLSEIIIKENICLQK